jgi:hypothetical protein
MHSHAQTECAGPFTFPLPLNDLDVARVWTKTKHHNAANERDQARQLGEFQAELIAKHGCNLGVSMEAVDQEHFQSVQHKLARLNWSLNRPTCSWWSCRVCVVEISWTHASDSFSQA